MPNSLDVRDTVALIYIRKNLIDDSLRMLRELVNQKPESPTFHLHLAMALYQKGDRPMAKKELEIALRNKPSEKEQNEIKSRFAAGNNHRINLARLRAFVFDKAISAAIEAKKVGLNFAVF